MIKFWATDKLQYVMANEGSVNITNTVKGMITRNEQVCEAQDKGYIEYLYTEGEKIRKNSVICTIKDTYYEDIIENKIDLVDGEIKRSQSDFGEKTYYTEKIKDMNNLLYDTIDTSPTQDKTSHISRPASRAARVHWNSWASAHLPNKLLSAPASSPRNRCSGGILGNPWEKMS